MEEKDSDLVQEYYLVYIRRHGSENDRYNLVKAYSSKDAKERVSIDLRLAGFNPDNYVIDVQKTIE